MIRALGLAALAASTFVSLALAPVGVVYFDLRDHDGQRLIQLVLLAIAASVVTAYMISRQQGAVGPGRSARRIALALALATLAVLSIVHASVVRAAMLEAGLMTALAVFAVGIGLTTTRYGAEKLLVIPVAASLLFTFAVAVRYVAALAPDAALLREHLLPAYSNYRFFNHVQTVTIPLIVAATLIGSRRLRGWATAALTLEFTLLFFTGGRATMAALGVATIVIAATFREKAAPWLARVAAAALVGVVLYILLFDWIPYWRGLPRDFSSGDAIARSELGIGGPRSYLWALASEYVRESPWLGIGPMHYAHRVNVEAAHPHNVYLQVAAEWGLPFALILFGVAAAGLARLLEIVRRADNDADRVFGFSLLAAAIGIAVDGMFSGNFVMPMSQLWIAFAIGLSLAHLRAAHSPPDADSPRKASWLARWSIAALCTVSQFAIWQGVWPEILDVNAQVNNVRAEIVNNERDNPRIWSHGWFR